jgi:FKBP-type peptidyl-prolyl cis-trans isomerase (trigger factor)
MPIPIRNNPKRLSEEVPVAVAERADVVVVDVVVAIDNERFQQS